MILSELSLRLIHNIVIYQLKKKLFNIFVIQEIIFTTFFVRLYS